MMPFAAMRMRAPSGDPGLAVFEAAEFSIFSIDNLLSDGRLVRNRNAAGATSKNIITLGTGYIRTGGGGATVTNFFADGPVSTLTATRLQFATDATVFSVYTGAPPAGDYTLKFKAKLNAGTSANVRYGFAATGYQTIAVNNSTWITISLSFTANGSNSTPFNIIPSVGGGGLDLLVDEFQWYLDSEGPIPDFADEAWDWSLSPQNKRHAGAIARSGNLLENSAGGAQGKVISPAFPAATTFTEATAIVAFRYDTLGLGYMLVTQTEAALGSTANTFQIGTTNGSGVVGQIQFQPVNQGTSRVEPLGEGWHLYAVRFKTGDRRTSFNGVELNRSTAAWAGFQARLLNIGGQTSASASKGDYGLVGFWDSFLSDADFQAAIDYARAQITAMGETPGAFPYMLIADGDSITATSTVGANGPSWAYMISAASEFSPPLYMRNMATSGHGIADLETGKTDVLRVVGECIANGAQPIVVVLIGTNDTAEIGTDGYLAYWAKLASYYADLRAGGAWVVACTLLPADVGNPAWDAERALLNAYMLTQTSAYDAIADLGGDPDIGPDAAPAARIYYYDDLHPNAVGQTIAMGIIKATLQTIMV